LEIGRGVERLALGGDARVWPELPAASVVWLDNCPVLTALPELPAELFIESLRQLIAVDGDWVPAPVNEKRQVASGRPAPKTCRQAKRATRLPRRQFPAA
jgi:hypothetical protein